MASLQYTVEDLQNETYKGKWDDVRYIIRTHPQLVCEKYHDLNSLVWLVLKNAPKDIIMESLEFVTTAVIEEVQIWDIHDRCILHLFAEFGYAQALCCALDKTRRQVNLQDQAGDSPLHWLLAGNHSFRIHLDMTKAFLKAGADISLQNKDCLTPEDMYIQNECGHYDNSTKEEQKKQLLLLLRVRIRVNLNNGHLMLIAKGVGRKGRQLGLRLGLPWKRIQQIWWDNRDPLDCIMGMIQEWRQEQSYGTNEVMVMALALKEQGLRGLAEEVFGSQIFRDLPSTVIWREHETHHKYNGYLADIDFLFIAKMLINWKALGSYLGIQQIELTQIQHDNALLIIDAIVEMLVRWRDEQRFKDDHLKKMREALYLLERGDIYKELETYYHEMYY